MYSNRTLSDFHLYFPLFGFRLWKKESCDLYRNPFDSIVINAPDVKAWAKVFSKSSETKKSHSMFQQQIILGNTAFIERDWDKAINFYNQALSFVERHTVSECILYANRAQCFHQLSLFGKALIDSDLALGSAMHVSDHVLMQLCSLRTEIARLDANQIMLIFLMQHQPSEHYHLQPCQHESFAQSDLMDVEKTETDVQASTPHCGDDDFDIPLDRP